MTARAPQLVRETLSSEQRATRLSLTMTRSSGQNERNVIDAAQWLWRPLPELAIALIHVSSVCRGNGANVGPVIANE